MGLDSAKDAVEHGLVTMQRWQLLAMKHVTI
jgi:hypothetical protein